MFLQFFKLLKISGPSYILSSCLYYFWSEKNSCSTFKFLKYFRHVYNSYLNPFWPTLAIAASWVNNTFHIHANITSVCDCIIMSINLYCNTWCTWIMCPQYPENVWPIYVITSEGIWPSKCWIKRLVNVFSWHVYSIVVYFILWKHLYVFYAPIEHGLNKG